LVNHTSYISPKKGSIFAKCELVNISVEILSVFWERVASNGYQPTTNEMRTFPLAIGKLGIQLLTWAKFAGLGCGESVEN